MSTTLVKSIQGERGVLYYLKEGRNITLAHCKIRLELYETRKKISTLGNHAGIKSVYGMLAITFDNAPTCEINEALLNTISGFKAVADFQLGDGIYERLTFDNMTLSDYIDIDDLTASWSFTVNAPYTLIKKLLIL